MVIRKLKEREKKKKNEKENIANVVGIGIINCITNDNSI